MDKGESILYRTHQSWKLTIAAGGILISAALMYVAVLRINDFPTKEFEYLGVAGGLVSLLSFVFPLAAIRYPKCGSHWLWLAATQRQLTWYRWLLSQSACPKCRTSPSTAAT